ncbi:hypothetical protein [Methanoeremita antiquus]|nr:hypothetical protein [Methanomicrobium antiquum]MDD3978389.1 hypothetical protein [Methanomicrobium sp.]
MSFKASVRGIRNENELPSELLLMLGLTKKDIREDFLKSERTK